MADYVVGITDGYHSIAFAGGLEPAVRQPFSIAAPTSQPQAEARIPTLLPARVESLRGAVADVSA